MSSTDDKTDESTSWNNTGTYIGVGGLVLTAFLAYNRSIKTTTAVVLAIIALVAGYYFQPAKKKDAAAKKGE